ncbi:hypothetical protein DOTSEDRAFT_28977 [Dothistroma septosporum NZE10]|uniref:Uncharacterized protein n=1 Tax=Dothistroma septosporum (strain NZE10 / CBS 128990) TaxID=675120 RepID=M2Y0C4_DOTSN|nr:hypothetical protein DOTSEDRAFT_28977 [Dothistroma septosporum NZE10]
MEISTDLSKFFMPREDHIQVRTCAKVLCALDNVLPRSRGVSANITSQDAAYPGTFAYIPSTHCMMLVLSMKEDQSPVSQIQSSPHGTAESSMAGDESVTGSEGPSLVILSPKFKKEKKRNFTQLTQGNQKREKLEGNQGTERSEGEEAEVKQEPQEG